MKCSYAYYSGLAPLLSVVDSKIQSVYMQAVFGIVATPFPNCGFKARFYIFFIKMSTNWLFAADSVSCYPASMANFILFTDEKCLLH